MLRTYDEEMIYRTEQRRRYFENPKYRKWSDVVTKCLDEASDGNDYAEIREGRGFESRLNRNLFIKR